MLSRYDISFPAESDMIKSKCTGLTTEIIVELFLLIFPASSSATTESGYSLAPFLYLTGSTGADSSPLYVLEDSLCRTVSLPFNAACNFNAIAVLPFPHTVLT